MSLKDKVQYNAYMAEYMLKRYHESREYIFSTLGRICTNCGSENNLNVDHINASEKSFYISKLWSVSWSRFTEEVNKCQILCQSCHIEKSKICGDYRRKPVPLD